MDGIKEALAIAVPLLTALGGWEFVKYMLNRKANSRIAEANAFKAAQEAWTQEYNRIQHEMDDLNKKVDELYKKVHELETERLDLIRRNNELEIQLKEAEKRVCLQPDDKCLQRLNPNDHCRLRKILRGEYAKDHPGAILTEEDMVKTGNKEVDVTGEKRSNKEE